MKFLAFIGIMALTFLSFVIVTSIISSVVEGAKKRLYKKYRVSLEQQIRLTEMYGKKVDELNVKCEILQEELQKYIAR